MTDKQRILIANRGEVAVRAIQTAAKLGLETVAVYSDADLDGTWMGLATMVEHIGPSALDESYLSISAILAAADRSKATAVFSGYGLLSERADFAQAVVDADLIWIGPGPSVMTQLGDKVEARRLAEAAGLPVIPGHDGPQEPAQLLTAAKQLGLPILVKPVAGGGGRGIRRVDEIAELPDALKDVKSEAERLFGDSSVLLEKLVDDPRHIEVQVAGDRLGNLVHLGTRECSLQRGYQKLIEEAPAPNLSEQMSETLCDQALALAREVSYDSVGTVEFLLDEKAGEHFFLEVNVGPQAERPVTEAVAGVDLVELTFLSAFRASFAELASPEARGHAIGARVNAEDPWDDFAPQTGVVTLVDVPEGARWDSAVASGTSVGALFDPLLGKLIVHGRTRADAVGQLRAALEGLCIGGVVSNAGFLNWLLGQSQVEAGTVTTEFVDRVKPDFVSQQAEATIVLRACDAARVGVRMMKEREETVLAESPWTALGSVRLLPTHVRTPYFFEYRGSIIELISPPSDSAMEGSTVRITGAEVTVLIDAHCVTLRSLKREDVWQDSVVATSAEGNQVLAPFPAVVVEILAEPGDLVDAGSVVVVVEAMKLLHRLKAPRSGRLDAVPVSVGDTVGAGQPLALLVPLAANDSA